MVPCLCGPGACASGLVHTVQFQDMCSFLKENNLEASASDSRGQTAAAVGRNWEILGHRSALEMGSTEWLLLALNNTRSLCVAEEKVGRAPLLRATATTCCFTPRCHTYWQEKGCFGQDIVVRHLWSQVRVDTFPLLLLIAAGCRTCGGKEGLLNVF